MWNDEAIVKKVFEVKDGLGIDRMPSKKECDLYFNNTALSNAISKRCGWHRLADELGLPMKKSETLLGKNFEKKTINILEKQGFRAKQMSQNFPYDILVNEYVKIDVKVSRLYKGKNGNFYAFNLEKPYATCDIYILIEISDEEEIRRIMIVPSKFVFTNNQISVGEKNSKYHSFTNRFDYITHFCEFFKKLS